MPRVRCLEHRRKCFVCNKYVNDVKVLLVVIQKRSVSFVVSQSCVDVIVSKIEKFNFSNYKNCRDVSRECPHQYNLPLDNPYSILIFVMAVITFLISTIVFQSVVFYFVPEVSTSCSS